MAAASAATPNSQVSQNEFLQLMVAQLKNQDPSSPQDNGQFLAQLAQFSTLSGIEQLNTSFSDLLKLQEITQGTNLVGKTVSYLDSKGTASSGVAKSATVGTDGTLSLTIGSNSIPLSHVTGVQ